jgi:hypothetical protein
VRAVILEGWDIGELFGIGVVVKEPDVLGLNFAQLVVSNTLLKVVVAVGNGLCGYDVFRLQRVLINRLKLGLCDCDARDFITDRLYFHVYDCNVTFITTR